MLPQCLKFYPTPRLRSRYINEARNRLSLFARSIATDQRCALDDGRSLGYAEYGSPTGTPVFYFHGTPGCRVEGGEWQETAVRRNVRFIGVDRPGIGLSSVKKGYKLLDWPVDVLQLARFLQLDKFHVIGGSGGGPYAVACARGMPKHVLQSAGVVAGMGPPEAGSRGVAWQRWVAYQFNLWTPPSLLERIIHASLVRPAQDKDPQVLADIIEEKIIPSLIPQDRAVFESHKLRQIFVDTVRESCRQGASGYVIDAKLMLGRWGFDLRDVLGRVKLWYGTDDVNTPIHMGRYLKNALPNAVLKEYSGESHFTIFARRQDEILTDLTTVD